MKLIAMGWEETPGENEAGVLNVIVEGGEVEFPLLIQTLYISDYDISDDGSVELDLYLYSENIKIYKDEKDYKENSKSRRAIESIIPSGLFPPRPDDNFVKTSTALINGVVTSIGKIRGEERYVTINCLGHTLTVVLFKRYTKAFETIEIGNIISGRFSILAYPADLEWIR